MGIDNRIIERFEQLISKAEILISNRTISGGHDETDDFREHWGRGPILVPRFDTINKQNGIQWATSSLGLIERIFGKNNHYYTKFLDVSNKLDQNNNLRFFEQNLGILKAAKDDYENGFLFDTQTLIEAEVFDDFIEQADHLLSNGYFQAAAVIAGAVLEDGLRKLCDKNSIVIPEKASIDPMNVWLTKAGIYNKLQQKKITVLADLRNKAAHGKWDEFERNDVEDMIRDVRTFMETYYN